MNRTKISMYCDLMMAIICFLLAAIVGEFAFTFLGLVELLIFYVEFREYRIRK